MTRTVTFDLPRRSGGLFRTLWPTDHGDTARRKFVTGGGLPAGFDPAQVKTITNPALPYVQWMYTREDGELFAYGVPGSTGGKAWLARVDSRTLEIRQRLVLPFSLYIGGALMHRNGDVYLVHGPRLYRFPQGDLDQSTMVPLPVVNGIFTQYNGLQVAEDGQLILKGWAMNVHELSMIRPLLLLFAAIGLVLGAAAGLVLRLLLGPAAGPLVIALCILLGPLALAAALALATRSSWLEFLRPSRTGHLLVVDPETLEVGHRVRPAERCAYARTAMVPADPAEEMERPGRGEQAAPPDEWLIIPGDEHIMRWRYSRGRLTYDPSWTERYRTWGDGSFPGTGPCVYRHVVYYTDNTFPVGLRKGYHLYRKPLDTTERQAAVDLSGDDPGFMFYAVVVSPAEGDILVWDTYKGFLEARRLADLSSRWRVAIRNTDCLTVSADRGHIYLTDHSEGLSLGEYMETASSRPKWPRIQKSFIVLDAADGRELLRIPLGQASPVAAMVVPGRDGDVFVSTRPALVRVYQA